METMATPLTILMDKGTIAPQKSEFCPPSAFRDYKKWLASDFNADAEAILSPCESLPSPSCPSQILQWAPQKGNSDSTISVILEQSPLESPREMKIIFGQLPLETTYHEHFLSSVNHVQELASNTASSSSTTILVTLTAKVPEAQYILPSPNSQVPILVYFYYYKNHDLMVDSQVIGTFTYTDGRLPLDRKRISSSDLVDDYPQKQAYSADSHTTGTVAIDQLAQAIASSDDSQTYNQQYTNGYSTTGSNDPDTAMWIAQQIYQQQQLQHSDQQYLFEDVTSVNTSYMNNLSLAFDSMASTDYGACHDNQDKLKFHFHALDDSFLDTNITHREDRVLNDTMVLTLGLQYNGYQDTGMYAQATNNGRVIKNAVFSKNNNNNSYNNNNSNMYGLSGETYNSNERNTSDSNKVSYNAARTPPSYNVTNMHPFAGLLNKANLKICGDLMQMTFHWSANEWKTGRRLVRFSRRQNTSNAENSQQVECGFEAIEYYNHQQEQQQQHLLRMNEISSDRLPNGSLNSPLSPLDDHAFFNSHPALNTEVNHSSNTTTGMTGTSSLVVSCIYWKERNDYFITSVDCIYLLEGLIGVQFTVEEKNRIRRNLEGFRPLTVSKYKTGCTDFFKLIMGFPHPKPRNIEKDVKVFSWKTLPHALRKIIRKYTPNDGNNSAPASTPTLAMSSSLPSPTQPPATFSSFCQTSTPMSSFS